jgi:hypothetical protein
VLLDAYTSPGGSDEAVRIFLARDVRAADGERVVGEHEEADLELRWVAPDDLVAGVLAGELHNPLIVMGALALRAALDGRGLDALRPADAPRPAPEAHEPDRNAYPAKILTPCQYPDDKGDCSGSGRQERAAPPPRARQIRRPADRAGQASRRRSR